MIIQITGADDSRLEPYSFIRERDVAGRGDRFIAEGKVVLNCLANSRDFQAESLLILDSRLAGLSSLLKRFAPDVPVYVAGQDIMDKIAGFHVHRGILASGVRTRHTTMKDIVGDCPDDTLLVVLSGVSNHDNVGGIFRNSAAFGANGVILDDQCCNPLYRKALRVSVGGVLNVPWTTGGSVESIVGTLSDAGFSLIALSPSGKKDVRSIPAFGKRALLLGSEGHGLPSTIMNALDTYRIPMKGGFDSLNVSTASAIALMLASA